MVKTEDFYEWFLIRSWQIEGYSIDMPKVIRMRKADERWVYVLDTLLTNRVKKIVEGQINEIIKESQF